jgi:hypothetical protein
VIVAVVLYVGDVIGSEHIALVPEQAPDQPPKVWTASHEAVRVTGAELNVPLHMPVHAEMPLGDELTDPPPPDTVTEI